MPQKVMLEDGTEKEVPTDEELKDLKAGHDANIAKRPIVEQYNKAVELLDLKEGQSIEERLTEMKEAENPNWLKMRETLKTLKDVAKGKGINIDDEGNVVEKQELLTPDKIQEIANKTFESNQIKAKKVDALSQFSKNDAETISNVFDRLQVLGGTFEENMQIAIEKVFPGQSVNYLKSAISSSGGGQSRQPKAGEASPELKAFGAKAFGLTEDDFKKV
jgi:hypothetical protein